MADLSPPPRARRRPTITQRATGPHEDDFAWLRDRDDPETIPYLEAENAWADAYFEPLLGLREQLFDEIKARTLETDLSVPVKHGDWWYFTRTQEGLQYPIHCRRPDETRDDDVEILLDENVVAEGHEFTDIGEFEVSPSHRRLAWSVDHDGSELYELRIRDLDTARDLVDRIPRTHYGCAWSSDDCYLFYTVPNETMRAFQVWRHRVGEPDTTNDVLIMQEDDGRFVLGVTRTRSGAYLVIEVASRTTTEVYVLEAASPLGQPRLIEPRRDGVEYHVDHQGDRFLIHTNLDAPDFRLARAPLDAPGAAHWTDVLPHRPGARVHSTEAFRDHIVVFEWSDFSPRIRLLLADGMQRVVAFDEEAYGVHPLDNPDYASPIVRFEYQSLSTPITVFDEVVTTGQRTMRKRQPVLGDFDSDRYESRREWAVAPDGTRIPISIVSRKGIVRDGSAPLCLYGYGSYEMALAPWFSIPRLSLLDRGIIWALAHVRGGGEGGRAWYLHGKLLEKRNTFDDFIACAEHLIAEKYTSRPRLAIRGGSAGGLLVGACVTMRPDLFGAVVAEVPFVDVVTTMHDTSLPLTVEEWDEWGNPRDPTYEKYIESYSPYDNVQPAAYPSMYITAGLNDPRVSYHEPAKFTAKLRLVTTGSAPIVFRCEMGAGHAGVTGRYESWRHEARTLAFIVAQLEKR